MLSFRKAVLILGLLSIASVARATPIVLGASHFSVAYDDAQTGLYGAASMSGSGDTVFFTPTEFKTSASNGATSLSSPFTMTLSIDPGYTFSGLSYSEGGDYFLLGGASVSIAAGVDVVNAATSAMASLMLSPSSPLDSVTSFANLQTTDWSVAGDLSLSGLGYPTSLQITLNNELLASSAAGGLGFIEKKFAGLQVHTQQIRVSHAVPEPSTWILLFAGWMAAWSIKRKSGLSAN